MDLMQSIAVSAQGMSAQSQRMKMIAENIANADSVERDGGGGPYLRKEIYFKAEVDRATGLTNVVVDRIDEDTTTPLKAIYEPNHELADEAGFVMYPNINTTIENVNLREASRSYEANMSAIETARDMLARSMDLLR